MHVKRALEKLQNQPESIRRAIVWGVTIAAGALLLFWWFVSIG